MYIRHILAVTDSCKNKSYSFFDRTVFIQYLNTKNLCTNNTVTKERSYVTNNGNCVENFLRHRLLQIH